MAEQNQDWWDQHRDLMTLLMGGGSALVGTGLGVRNANAARKKAGSDLPGVGTPDDAMRNELAATLKGKSKNQPKLNLGGPNTSIPNPTPLDPQLPATSTQATPLRQYNPNSIQSPAMMIGDKMYHGHFYDDIYNDALRSGAASNGNMKRGFVTWGGQFVDPVTAARQTIMDGHSIPSPHLATEHGMDDIDFWGEWLNNTERKGNTGVADVAARMNTSPSNIKWSIDKWRNDPYNNANKLGNSIISKTSRSEE